MDSNTSGKLLLKILVSGLVFFIALQTAIYFDYNSVYNIIILIIIWFAYLIYAIITFGITEFRDWSKQIFHYNGVERIASIDRAITDFRDLKIGYEEVFAEINKAYEGDYSIADLLERQHFVRNHFKIQRDVKDLSMAAAITVLFQYLQYELSNYGEAKYVILMINIITAVAVVIALMIAYNQADFNWKEAFYEYEANMIERKLKKKQRKIQLKKHNNDMD